MNETMPLGSYHRPDADDLDEVVETAPVVERVQRAIRQRDAMGTTAANIVVEAEFEIRGASGQDCLYEQGRLDAAREILESIDAV